MAESVIKLAVLIDADNASPVLAPALLAEVAKFGISFVRRAYGDWTGTNLKSWKTQLLTQSIQPIQQFAYTQGKNATDSAMIIDAMDLLYSNRFDGFCLVSSDSDFTRLASRIRESGLVVYGFGEKKTPKPFVSACDKFIYFENIITSEDPIPPSLVDNSVVNPPPPRTPPPNTPVDIETKLQLAIRSASDEEGWASLAKVGSLLNRQISDFDPRNFGFHKLGELVISTGLFEVESRRPGAGKPVLLYAREKSRKRARTSP